jgi:hypothetical protein
MSVIELPHMTAITACVDKHAAELANIGLTSDNADVAIDTAASPFERSVARALRDRLKVYETAAPWHLYPVNVYSMRLAMLLIAHGLSDVYEGEEYDALMNGFLDPIKADLIEKGFSHKVAEDWCESLAGESGCAGVEINLALKIIDKTARQPEKLLVLLKSLDINLDDDDEAIN